VRAPAPLVVAWQAQAREVDTLRAVNAQLLRILEADRGQSVLRRWGRVPSYELVAGIVAQLWLARFLTRHLEAPALLASGLVLAVAAFLAALVAARQVVMLAEVDHTAPVAELQQSWSGSRRFASGAPAGPCSSRRCSGRPWSW